jgi:hypothetical protein
VDQGSRYQKQTQTGDKDRTKSGPEHRLRPVGHVLLGVQIGYFALLLPLTLGLVFAGYQAANRGFDFIERGRKYVGGALLICAAVFNPLVAIGLPWVGYWIAFDGGLGWLLGI